MYLSFRWFITRAADYFTDRADWKASVQGRLTPLPNERTPCSVFHRDVTDTIQIEFATCYQSANWNQKNNLDSQ